MVHNHTDVTSGESSETVELLPVSFLQASIRGIRNPLSAFFDDSYFSPGSNS